MSVYSEFVKNSFVDALLIMMLNYKGEYLIEIPFLPTGLCDNENYHSQSTGTLNAFWETVRVNCKRLVWLWKQNLTTRLKLDLNLLCCLTASASSRMLQSDACSTNQDKKLLRMSEEGTVKRIRQKFSHLTFLETSFCLLCS